MYWINIDNPTKSATVHAESCRHMGERKKRPEDGKWIAFETLAEAVRAADNSRLCGHCLKHTKCDNVVSRR